MLSPSRLGIPLAVEKVVGPSTVLSFLGIELDTLLLVAPLPTEKVSALQDLLQSWSNKRVCHHREFSLLGHLHHTVKVVYPGRPFLHCLTNLLHGMHSQSWVIRLNSAARADLLWWSSFIWDWNGTSFISPRWSNQSDLQVSTDAARATGFGAYLDGLWFTGRWLPKQLSVSIAFKELYPVVLAAHVWGYHVQGLWVQFLCDNCYPCSWMP